MKRWAVRVVLLSVALLVLAGCSTIGTLIDTQDALRNNGYQSVNVSPKGTTNSLDVQVTVAAPPTTDTANKVASIVWQKFHERFDYVHITVRGQGPAVQEDLTFAQMQEAFGARNPAWNSKSVKSSTLRIGVVAIVGVAVVLGGIVATILLVQRRNRRRRPPWPGQYPGGGYPGQYPGPASPPPGGYGYPGVGGPYGSPPSYPPYPPAPGNPPRPDEPPAWPPPPEG